jgi:DNA-binding NarL/FixJ family response regulator
METITLIICDDHPIFRQGLINILEQDESLKLLGECADGKSALRLIKELNPDVAVIDISMPEMDGLEVARLLQDEKSPTKIVILTMYKEEEYFNVAMDAGVKGYLLKENAAGDLVSCLKAVKVGHYYVSSLLSDLLIKRENQIKSLKKDIPAIETLTEMERKILHLIAYNKTSKEIAKELFISHRTVQNHRQHISDKLNLHGPHKLLQFALENKSLI